MPKGKASEFKRLESAIVELSEQVALLEARVAELEGDAIRATDAFLEQFDQARLTPLGKKLVEIVEEKQGRM